jgi:antitoxin VapB
MTVRSRLFLSNRSQAVRIPKELRFPETVRDIEIVRVGDALVMRPVRTAPRDWAAFFDGAPRFSDDFLMVRDDPPPQERDFG